MATTAQSPEPVRRSERIDMKRKADAAQSQEGDEIIPTKSKKSHLATRCRRGSEMNSVGLDLLEEAAQKALLPPVTDDHDKLNIVYEPQPAPRTVPNAVPPAGNAPINAINNLMSSIQEMLMVLASQQR